MFFILSKILLFVLVPVCWVIVLFIWSLLTKKERRRKRLRIAILVIFLVFSNPLLYRSLMLAWQPTPPAPMNRQYEVGILLGGMAGYDTNDRGYFGAASDRFIQTANLYHSGTIKKIIVTGGTGSLTQNEPPEAFFLRQSFIANGIPDSVIIVESRSRNTYENGVYTKTMIDSIKARPPFVLITSAMHMPRSASVFRKAGYDFVAYPCNYEVYPSKFSLYDTIIPDMALMNKWAMFLKEVVGLAAYRLTGKA
ncbi:YdcF family protein [Sediminibacterium soli]|uniref:YdcF family protein n=1 Tax=Sediminibacterium soli TaxID=2698829 RepID=UPI00137B65B9|nr:YdcF family protein [Sediminibacterium soli]NCI47134.1 YdcF family protein [Sediminibacterium soli]